ncbi:anthranilate phosphoribosyltransferase [candidate division KSB1 bacterium]|nr:anthranilate phosphoribosyltransferase [candidate division KSB1 bacterium]
MVKQTLEKVAAGQNLSEQEAHSVMTAVMNGEWTPVQIAGLLMALKIKGETIDEISGFVRVMRDKAVKINASENTIDTCGTGGDSAGTFNISTAAAITAAAAGVPVAKHGNRSVSSQCGSADVLQEIGVKIDITHDQAQNCLDSVGIVFLFAPVYHASMKHAVIPRREMGIRTVFNILGPMSNPALVKRQFLGAFNTETAEKMVRVLQQTGSHHVVAVHSKDGLDEISLAAPTSVYELRDDQVTFYEITPDEFGINTSSESVVGGNAAENADIIWRIFAGEPGAAFDITRLNAGAAIYIGGKAGTLAKGVAIATDTILSGNSAKKLGQLVDFCRNLNG